MGEEVRKPLAVDPASVTVRWFDSQRYSPAPRHRKRLILQQVRELDFRSCLDVGCAQGYLLDGIHREFPCCEVCGCDLSEEVVHLDRRMLPWGRFEAFDLAKGVWPGQRQFDLVVCSEVMEHIPDWESAAGHLAQMTGRFLLITVPCGQRYWIDEHIGHFHHFAGPEIAARLKASGLRLRTSRRWGFPFHSLYKKAINRIAPGRMYAAFGEGPYGAGKKLVSDLLYGLFFFNDWFRQGSQLILLFERPGNGSQVEK